MLKSYYSKGIREVGVDEAGRGCLAGPVFAAAVRLPEHFVEEVPFRDSKKMSAEQREVAKDWIVAHCDYAIAWAGPGEIDEINILQASLLAMHRAIEKLEHSLSKKEAKLELLLIDGIHFNPYAGCAHECVKRGDDKYFSIAAASILAKTARDAYMRSLAKEWPGYGWESNFAYPTKKHRQAIAELGPCPHHRKSFRLLGPKESE